MRGRRPARPLASRERDVTPDDPWGLSSLRALRAPPPSSSKRSAGSAPSARDGCGNDPECFTAGNGSGAKSATARCGAALRHADRDRHIEIAARKQPRARQVALHRRQHRRDVAEGVGLAGLRACRVARCGVSAGTSSRRQPRQCVLVRCASCALLAGTAMRTPCAVDLRNALRSWSPPEPDTSSGSRARPDRNRSPRRDRR